jgi:hypothetical protein
MPLYMDVHHMDGPVNAADVAKAHEADLAIQGNHGQYVSSVAHQPRQPGDAPNAHGQAVSAAAQSDCGKPSQDSTSGDPESSDASGDSTDPESSDATSSGTTGTTDGSASSSSSGGSHGHAYGHSKTHGGHGHGHH